MAPPKDYFSDKKPNHKGALELENLRPGMLVTKMVDSRPVQGDPFVVLGWPSEDGRRIYLAPLHAVERGRMNIQMTRSEPPPSEMWAHDASEFGLRPVNEWQWVKGTWLRRHALRVVEQATLVS